MVSAGLELFGKGVFSPKQIVEDLMMGLVSDLMNSDEQVIGAMAETNAFGYGVDVYEVLNAEYFDSRQQIKFRARIWLSGEQDQDKPYCGDAIEVIVSGIVKYFDYGWDIQYYEIESCEINW